MDKGTVFLSHSSKDKRPLAEFKAALDVKTHGTLKFFLSSDGQSIPFGRNWVSSVETALNDAKLAFLFLTPNSINSTWVAFEAGYMYSKGIEVIPVALPGIEMSQVPPPISLLQGFNMHSHGAMNNVFAILNQVFNHRHDPAFSDADFRNIFGADSELAAGFFGEYSALIRAISFSGKAECDVVAALRDTLKEQAIDLVSSSIMEPVPATERNQGAPSKVQKHIAAAHGIKVVVEVKPASFEVMVHSEMCNVVLPTIAQTIAGVTKEHRIDVEFVKGVKPCGGNLSLTARAFGTNVKVIEDGEMEYEGVTIDIPGLGYGNENHLYLNSKSPISAERIREIVMLLFQQEMVLFEPDRTDPALRVAKAAFMAATSRRRK
jgi:hypothetical protein